MADPTETPSILDKITQFGSGMLKGATTDLVGAPVDIINTILKAVGVPTSDEPIGGSKNLRRTLSGDANVEDKSLYETAGTLLNPETAAKAMIIAAARIPARLDAFEKFDAAKVLAENPGKLISQVKTERFDTSGAYLDRDAKVKTMISDRNAVVQGDFSRGQTLSDILDHPTLYSLYPELKDIPIKWEGAPNSGSMDVNNKLMTIGKNTDTDQLRSTILHETQHAIQHIEDFGRGGNTKQFLTFDPTSVGVKLTQAKLSGDEAQIQAADRFKQKLDTQLQEAANRYMNLPGEQEARYTEYTRFSGPQDLTANVRKVLSSGNTPQTFDTRPIRPVPTSTGK